MATRTRRETPAETKERIQRAHNVPVIPLRPALAEETSDCAEESYIDVPSGEQSTALVCMDTTGRPCGFLHGSTESALECPVRATRQGVWTISEQPDSIYAWATRKHPFDQQVVSAETAADVLKLYHSTADKLDAALKQLKDAEEEIRQSQRVVEDLQIENDDVTRQNAYLRQDFRGHREKAEKWDFLVKCVRGVETELGHVTLRYADGSFVAVQGGDDLDDAVSRALLAVSSSPSPSRSA